MKTNKPRNRESRTKPIPTESSVAIRLRLPRESYDQMRDLVTHTAFFHTDPTQECFMHSR